MGTASLRPYEYLGFYSCFGGGMTPSPKNVGKVYGASGRGDGVAPTQAEEPRTLFALTLM